jgi:hypothetical protein
MNPQAPVCFLQVPCSPSHFVTMFTKNARAVTYKLGSIVKAAHPQMGAADRTAGHKGGAAPVATGLG